MRRTGILAGFFAYSAYFLLSAAAFGAQPAGGFDAEEIKPYIKIMDGPWVGNAVSGGAGAYTVRVKQLYIGVAAEHVTHLAHQVRFDLFCLVRRVGVLQPVDLRARGDPAFVIPQEGFHIIRMVAAP